MAAMSHLHETLARQEAAALQAHEPLLRLLAAAEGMERASPTPDPPSEHERGERAAAPKRPRTRR